MGGYLLNCGMIQFLAYYGFTFVLKMERNLLLFYLLKAHLRVAPWSFSVIQGYCCYLISIILIIIVTMCNKKENIECGSHVRCYVFKMINYAELTFGVKLGLTNPKRLH